MFSIIRDQNPAIFNKLLELGFLNRLTDFILWTTEAYPFPEKKIKKFDEINDPFENFQNLKIDYELVNKINVENRNSLIEFDKNIPRMVSTDNQKLKNILRVIRLISLDRSSSQLENYTNENNPLPSLLFSKNIAAFKVLIDLFSLEYRESTNNTRAREKINNSVVPEIQLEIICFLKKTLTENKNCITLCRKFNVCKLLLSPNFYWNYDHPIANPIAVSLLRYNVLDFIQIIINKKEWNCISEFKMLLVKIILLFINLSNFNLF